MCRSSFRGFFKSALSMASSPASSVEPQLRRSPLAFIGAAWDCTAVLAVLDQDSRAVLRRVIGPMGFGYFAYGIITLAMGADVLLIGWLGSAVLAAEFALLWKPAEVLTQILWNCRALTPFLIRHGCRRANESVWNICTDAVSTGLPRWRSLPAPHMKCLAHG